MKNNCIITKHRPEEIWARCVCPTKQSRNSDVTRKFCVSFRKLDVWLSLGGFHEKGHDWKNDQRIYNSHIIINGLGTSFIFYACACLVTYSMLLCSPFFNKIF